MFTLTRFIIPILIWIIFCTIVNYINNQIIPANALASILFAIILNTLTFMSFVFMEHIFLEIRHYSSYYIYLD